MYQCNKCNKVFENSQKHNAHQASHSTKVRKTRKDKKHFDDEIKSYECKHCGKICENGKSLGGHLTHCLKNPKFDIIKENMRLASKDRLHTEETKLKISKSRKKYLNENPGQIPYLLNHSSKESYPEMLFREGLEKQNIKGWTYNYPIKRYAIDFAFIEHKLAVEIDGGTHNLEKVKEKDKIRDKTLSKLGWKTIRFSDYMIKTELDECLAKLKHLLKL
jgi:very-short-patch-repair endonuclease/DNA-directed RNA polymerase subunit RPC12/RpoP